MFGGFKSALTTELGLPTQSTPADPMNPAPLPPNRLQEAMSKLASGNRPIVSQTPIEGTIHLDTPSSGTSIDAASQSSNSFSVLIEGAQPNAEHGASISPGTASTVSAPLPIAAPLNAPVRALTPQPFETKPFETKPSEFGVTQTAPIVNQQPFTVPRSVPGRTIGGGNINTFSNP